MPFTLSHPAAVLPLQRLLRGRLPFAALVAGSIAPDTNYFLTPFGYFRESSHTLIRSFTFGLPVGLAILALFTALRPGILCLMPGGLRHGLDQLCERNPWRPSRFCFTALAVLVGVWSHLFWDSWTHSSGYFVQHYSALREPLVFGFSTARILQHLSTAFGLLALYWFLSAEGRIPVQWKFSWRWAFWGSSLVLCGAFTWFTLTEPWNYWISDNEHRLGYLAVVTLLRNLAAVAAATALVITLRRQPAAKL